MQILCCSSYSRFRLHALKWSCLSWFETWKCTYWFFWKYETYWFWSF